MTSKEIEKLAKSDRLLTNIDLDRKLTELKSKECGILECILYVKITKGCSLIEAKSIVMNSSTWIDEKEDFTNNQQEQIDEFYEAAKDNIESIQHTYISDKTEIKFKMRRKK